MMTIPGSRAVRVAGGAHGPSVGIRSGERSGAARARQVPGRGRRHGNAVVLRAAESDDELGFEERLAKLKAAKGDTGRGRGTKSQEAGTSKAPPKGGKLIDWSGETEFFVGKPSTGDLIFNIALGATLLWLPLTAAAIGRYAWVTYRITDRRISISSASPLLSEQTDIPYSQVKNAVAVGRLLGLWGDMVINLKDGSKIEVRSVENFMELRDYINARATEAREKAEAEAQKTMGF